MVTSLAFSDERLMNRALENGARKGSPVPLRLARLAAHPTAVSAAFRQLVLHKPRRQADAQREIERLDGLYHYDVITAVCAPYRAAFALEAAAVPAKKALWQLDPYAANREYAAPGGAAREAELLRAMAAAFVTRQALPDYESGPLAACKEKIHPLEFPSLIPPTLRTGRMVTAARHAGVRCVFCGSLYPDIRTPDFALRLFAALNLPEVTLVMAGGGWEPFARQAAEARRALGDRLVLPGVVPAAQARTLLENADVLLSLGNTVDNQMPSKIFEYFGLGKPILHLAVSEQDPVLPYLQRYPLGTALRAADGVSELTVAALLTWLKATVGRSLPFADVVRLYPSHTPAAVADAFLDVFV